ncbi:HDL068Wp [Eremothecium sinecaudum]|uniref:HDL068Wp n=1 Tax=Eremothecium sinecaudum TaxID=45286 RepID=A0A0X8HSK0_9SACH|nr:HDL068Wp [Eremothecium sinecaudum]AMD20676.1 HDL068Wp [Eremothecium sinecaudum]
MPFYFAIIGHKDNAIYSAEFTLPQQPFTLELQDLNPFILHASLDVIEDLQWQATNSNALTSNNSGLVATTGTSFLRSRHSHSSEGGPGSCYLSKVDHFYGLAITGYITYGNIKFVMVHGNSSSPNTVATVDDGVVKSFYKEVHELYIKTLLNPFYKVDAPITSPVFDSKVRALAKKYLIR